MNLIPWRNKRHNGNTGTAVAELRHEMDRLFDAFVRDPFGGAGLMFGAGCWAPPLDVAETDREVIVKAEVPGVDPKDLEITVSSNRLTLSGEKRETNETEGSDYYHAETTYGSFHRSIDLPSGVEADQVTARHANGVVTIKLKKSQAAATKKIPVTSA